MTPPVAHLAERPSVNAPYGLINRSRGGPEAERVALVSGLLQMPASISPKYFYDAMGCALFGAICALPEYYPTRTEQAIFDRHQRAIAAAMGAGKTFVDLGAGDCRKARRWLAVVKPQRYVAVDIAADEIAKALDALTQEFPRIAMTGVIADFTHALDLGAELGNDPTTFFYPGSSIGNFAPDAACRLLNQIRAHCSIDSGLLIGVDTKKDVRRLIDAYDDALGVTAAFNRNVLRHINHILNTNFAVDAFKHVALYDAEVGRIEMHLEALSRQVVRLDDHTRVFAAGERIHTENSYKYTPDEFAAMLKSAGFARIQRWQDEQGDFVVFYAE